MDNSQREFIQWCYNQHDVVCNQKYDNTLPYSFHLKAVLSYGKRFHNLLDVNDLNAMVCGCVGHDLIEDARVTFNDVMARSDERIAEIIFLCTEMRGRSRKERKTDEFYTGLATNKIAVYVKLCDIMANTSFSIATSSGMYAKQQGEWPRIREFLYRAELESMFQLLDKLYAI